MKNLRDQWALVTGASSGLGVDFADILAGKGCHLVISARREEQLLTVKQQIEKKHDVTVEVMPMDLSVPGAPQALYDAIKQKGIEIEVLINNAGFGAYGHFKDIPWEREQQMLNLNIVNLVHFMKLYLKDMLKRDSGYILNVASIGAYQPTPTYASYSASKSYVLFMTEAVNYELRDSNVKVTALSPGITKTEFLDVTGQNASLYQRIAMMESRPVCEAGIEAMLKGKSSYVPGLINKLGVVLLRTMPRPLQTMTANLFMTVGNQS